MEKVEVTLWDLALLGGWAMVPLALFLIFAIYIFFERYFLLRRYNQDPTFFMNQIREYIRRGDVKGAEMLCVSTATPFARMVAKGISRLGNSLQDITTAIQNEGNLEILKLEKNLSYLATVAGTAPMVGFLGTVSGLIQAFMKIAHLQGNVNPSVLAGGIYEAMVTTAAGLIVGIPAYIAYNILSTMLQNLVLKMEATAIAFIDLLQEPVQK